MSTASRFAATLLGPAAPVRWLIWAGYVTAWTAALLVPVPVEPDTGLRSPAVLFVFAKFVHLSAYALLAVLTGWLRAPGKYRWLLLAFLPAHAALTEFLQWLLPTGRTGCIQDVLLDLVGISVGMALSWRWWRAAWTGFS
jgi:VanZ family protein